MRFVKSLVYLAPAALVFIACDTNANEPTPVETVASMGMTAELGGKRECTTARQNAEPSIDAATFSASTCEVDADCTVATTDTMCFGTLHHAVSFTGFGSFMMRVAKADARFCASVPDTCGANVDSSSYAAVCDAGHCALAVAKVSCLSGEVATSEGCLAPELARAKAQNALEVALDAAASCQSDAECVQVVDMTGCASTCGVAINQNAAGTFGERMGEIISDYCASDIGIEARCAATVPACVENRCELVSK